MRALKATYAYKQKQLRFRYKKRPLRVYFVNLNSSTTLGICKRVKKRILSVIDDFTVKIINSQVIKTLDHINNNSTIDSTAFLATGINLNHH